MDTMTLTSTPNSKVKVTQQAQAPQSRGLKGTAADLKRKAASPTKAASKAN